jgi:hypothetical protein
VKPDASSINACRCLNILPITFYTSGALRLRFLTQIDKQKGRNEISMNTNFDSKDGMKTKWLGNRNGGEH